MATYEEGWVVELKLTEWKIDKKESQEAENTNYELFWRFALSLVRGRNVPVLGR